MTAAEIEQAVLDALSEIAPEADPASLRPDTPLRDQLDIDSFDFLRLVIRIHERLGVEIPEADYGRLATLSSAVAYLAALTPRASAGPGAAASPPEPTQGR